MRSQISRIFHLGLCVLALSLSAGGDAYAQYAGFNDPGARSGNGAAAGGGLVPVLPTVDGGTVPTGATAQVVVRFRNDGGQPVETGLIRLYPSSTVSANVALNQCEETPLAPGAECAVALSVKGLQAGSWRVEMLMSHNGKTRLVSATLSGQVEAGGEGSETLASDIEAIPAEVDFGSMDASQTITAPIILRNITSTALDISAISIDASDQSGYALKTECKELEPGQACIAIVSWSPKTKGRSSGVLVVRHTGPTALTSVPLVGEFKPESVEKAEVFPQAVPGRGLLVASQSEIDFGTAVQTASTITVSLVNAGDAPVTIQDIRISGSDNGLSFKDNGCLAATVLEPIQACPLTITWSPTRVGSLYDDIQILHDGARGVLVLPIRGGSEQPVSQDQKAIVLNGGSAVQLPLDPSLDPNASADIAAAAKKNAAEAGLSSYSVSVPNAASVLDGYKITSFSPTRAIINGPGGSRIVFDNEEIVLGGVPWFVAIQKNGIEFLYQGQRILLLFDRSLSSINRVSSSSNKNSSAGGNSSVNSAPASPGANETGG
ncbi:MAG: choice-of-anchor D domain-containing protein [Alphaproteobacteria bacterium PRO2]|nr:choice-of-anchor D domain-containing protein [Alphaproteobacteria bacterium PRO2]